MRNWIDIVEAVKSEWSGMGPLYHGTDLISLALIIIYDKMSPSIDSQHSDHQGVSFTPDLFIARSFANRSTHIFDENHNGRDLELGKIPATGAVITVDSNKLKQQYRLVDYVDHLTFDDDEEGNEDEVRVLGGSISPLDRYMVSFSFNAEDVDWFVRFLETDYASIHWDHSDDISTLISTLHSLVHHPKYRPN